MMTSKEQPDLTGTKWHRTMKSEKYERGLYPKDRKRLEEERITEDENGYCITT